MTKMEKEALESAASFAPLVITPEQSCDGFIKTEDGYQPMFGRNDEKPIHEESTSRESNWEYTSFGVNMHSSRKVLHQRSTGCSALEWISDGEKYCDENITLSIKNNDEVERLVNYLAKCRQYSCSLENLSIHRNLPESSARMIAKKYSGVFSLKGKTLILKPKLKVCRAHSGPFGCHEREACCDLHICSRYVMENCQAFNCGLGHNWATGHNHAVLKKLFIATLPVKILQNFLKANGETPKPECLIDICQDYNSCGCSDENCPRLHICAFFFTNIVCGKKSECSQCCPYSHDIVSRQCLRILTMNGISVNETPKDIAQAITISNPALSLDKQKSVKRKKMSSESDGEPEMVAHTVWSYHLKGDVHIKEICYQSVENICPLEESGCQRLHSTYHFHWQISENNNQWFNLRPAQVLCLERAFSNPERMTVTLPRLDPTTLGSSLMSLFHVMGRETWSANFHSMKLRNLPSSQELFLRRLQTESVQNVKVKGSTYCWYFLNDHQKWESYGNCSTGEDANFTSNTFSEQIEQLYLSNPHGNLPFPGSASNYILDFSKMIQTNMVTGRVRNLRRRPEPHLLEVDMKDLPETWDVMLPETHLLQLTLLPESPEYKKVSSLLTQKNTLTFLWTKIERIQNPYLWRAFQNKIKEMTGNSGSLDAVDIQYLFHEANPDGMNRICLENFDWRFHGSIFGNAFGKGTCFSTEPLPVAIRAHPNVANECHLFIAKVAVGSKAIGNCSMIRPPLNRKTNKLFDSTVDMLPNPKIIVKYDKQEYYPAYLVTFPRFL
ncbi:protein mono-ADP-ribosyltransferase PARP12-like isoform X1 [Macrobrachium rosenbergii]|uniref:protein mono-ADP-ribosyltransferase PARP12-like isoform X1 n=1 Tax=Macrobrachium rosenbergii TaxID=79674 RepID=UPI0034D62E60